MHIFNPMKEKFERPQQVTVWTWKHEDLDRYAQKLPPTLLILNG